MLGAAPAKKRLGAALKNMVGAALANSYARSGASQKNSGSWVR